jgi:transcriptional regulator with XRE-family HTH domain
MRRKETDFASDAAARASRHMGALVRQARLARAWTQQGLAERARISLATLKRIEGGAVEVSLGGWLAVFESVGLLPLIAALRDPASAALLDATRAKRARTRTRPRDDLDF